MSRCGSHKIKQQRCHISLLGESFNRGNTTRNNQIIFKMGSNTSQQIADNTEEWRRLYISHSNLNVLFRRQHQIALAELLGQDTTGLGQA